MRPVQRQTVRASASSAAAATSTADAATTNSSSSSSDHAWRAPTSNDSRGPCPALNILANHGYLPRDGRATAEQLVDGMHEGLGISKRLGGFFARVGVQSLGKDGVLALNDLNTPGVIEHDASMSRADAACGGKGEINEALVQQLLSFSRDGKTLTKSDLAAAQKARINQSAAGLRASVIGVGEASLLFEVFKKKSEDGTEALHLEDLRSVFGSERLPENFQPRSVGVPCLALRMMTVAKDQLPLTEGRRRASEASASTKGQGCPFHPPATGDKA